MKTKTAILILIIIALVGGGVISYILFFSNNGASDTTVPTSNNQEQTFFPISNSPNNNQNDSGDIDQVETNEFNLPKLRQISKVPVSGFTLFERTSTSSVSSFNTESGSDEFEEITETIYRYMERATGHIYETSARDSLLQRITNTTIPKVYKTLFSNDQKSVVLQYLSNSNQVETFVGEIKNPETSTSTNEFVLSEIVGSFLPEQIDNVEINNSIFYTKTDDLIKKSSSYLTNFSDISTQENVFESNLSEWAIEWPNENIVTFTNKSSSDSNGSLYFFNINNNSFNKIFSGGFGFTTLTNSDLSKVLYSENSSNRPELLYYDIEENQPYYLEIATLPEKCVWSKTNTNVAYCAVPRSLVSTSYPDNWYQGRISFNDSLVKIDIENVSVEIVPGLTQNFDIIEPQLSANEDYITFINKKDLTLWSLDLES